MRHNSMATFLRKGEEALDRGCPHEAHKYLDQALAIDINSITGHFYMALAKMKLGLLSAAEKHAKTVLKLNPEEGHANLNLGIIREKRRDLRSAKRYYLQEIKINPSSPHAYYNLGRIYFRRKEWKTALAMLLQSRKHKGQAPFLTDDIAWAAYKSGDLRTERAIYKSVLETDPRNSWALNNLAATYIDTHSYDRALPLLTTAQKLRPADAMVKRNLARCSKENRGKSIPGRSRQKRKG